MNECVVEEVEEEGEGYKEVSRDNEGNGRN